VGSDDPDSESASAAVEPLVLSLVAQRCNTELFWGNTSLELLAGWVAAYNFDSLVAVVPAATPNPSRHPGRSLLPASMTQEPYFERYPGFSTGSATVEQLDSDELASARQNRQRPHQFSK
jgi:hypothetical protein